MATKKSFPVLNMSCASCAASAESTVKKQAGVRMATVNFASGLLTVEYESEQIGAEDLQKAVQAAGYDLLIEESDDQQEQLEAREQQHLKVLRNWKVRAGKPWGAWRCRHR